MPIIIYTLRNDQQILLMLAIHEEHRHIRCFSMKILRFTIDNRFRIKGSRLRKIWSKPQICTVLYNPQEIIRSFRQLREIFPSYLIIYLIIVLIILDDMISHYSGILFQPMVKLGLHTITREIRHIDSKRHNIKYRDSCKQ